MTQETQIRRRPDGSVDAAFYLAQGRMHRSRKAHRMLDATVGSACRPLLGLAILAVLVPFLGGVG
ncbi:MAG: hypothetical protein AAGG09_09710 [Pseudomonadota bacterium]